MKLANKPKKVLHITSGVGNEVRISELLRDADRIANIKRKSVVPMFFFDLIRKTFLRSLLPREFWRTCEMAQPYYYYLKGTGVRFDAYSSDVVLKDLGVKKPQWNEYKKTILTFCTDSKWGRRIRNPSYTYYQV